MKRYNSLLLLLTCLILGACSLVDDGPLPECPAPVDFMLSFTVDASEISRASRADDQGHDEVDADYAAFENGMDLDRLAIYVFARRAGATDEQLIFATPRLGAETSTDIDVIGGAGSYTVKLMMSKAGFEEKIGKKMSADDTERIIFRILMVSGITPSVSATTFTGILDGLAGYKVAMSELFSAPAAPDVTQLVTDCYPGERKYIPMFGTNTFTVSQYALVNSALGREAYLGGVDMLRSVAKVRVVDNIRNKDDNGYPRIVSARLVASQDELLVLPAGAATYVNGDQVHTAALAAPGEIKPLTLPLGAVPSSWTVTPAIDHRGDIFTGYAPEMKISNADTTRPYFQITVALRSGSNGDVTKSYTVPMAGGSDYPDIRFGDYVLRNHIYTLSIERVNLDELTLEVAVNDWKTLNFNYEY